MSINPYFFIEIFDSKTGNWEQVNIYTYNPHIDSYIPINVWSWRGGARELFSVLQWETSYDVPEFSAIHEGFPINASQEMYAELDKHCAKKETNGFDYVPKVKYFNMADAKLYLAQYPTIVDSDQMEEYWTKNEDLPWESVPKIEMQNPLQPLIDRIELMLEFWDEYWFINTSWSDVRVIFWYN